MKKHINIIRYLLFLAISLLFTAISEASEFPYFDLNATSPNGLYKVSVKYDPVHHIGPPTIILSKNNQIVWRKEDPSELNAPPPTEIYVTDDGSLFSCGIDEYYMFDKSGRYKYIFDLRKSVIKHNEKKYCSYSMSIGTYCHEFSQTFPVEVNGKTYICIQLYWGRFFVIDTHNGKLTTQSEILTAVENTIINKTLKDIHNTKEFKYNRGNFTSFKKELIPSVFVSSKYNIHEGEKLISDFIDSGNHFYVNNLCDSLPQNHSHRSKCQIMATNNE